MNSLAADYAKAKLGESFYFQDNASNTLVPYTGKSFLYYIICRNMGLTFSETLTSKGIDSFITPLNMLLHHQIDAVANKIFKAIGWVR